MKEKENEKEIQKSEIEQVADLTIEVDSLKEQLAKERKEKEEAIKKCENEHNANIRLMTSINQRQNQQLLDEEDNKKKFEKVNIVDYYDFDKNRFIDKK